MRVMKTLTLIYLISLYPSGEVVLEILHELRTKDVQAHNINRICEMEFLTMHVDLEDLHIFLRQMSITLKRPFMTIFEVAGE